MSTATEPAQPAQPQPAQPGEARRTPPRARRSRVAALLGRHPVGIVLAAPYAVFLALVFAWPLALAVWISFHDYFFAAPGAQVDRPFVGLDNYREVLADPDVRESFVNVAVFLVINVPLTVGLSLVLAAALNGAVRGRTFLRVSFYIPYVTASVALVAVWLFLFSNGGMVNEILGPLAPDPSWLVNSGLAMPVIAMFVTWKQMGFFILLYLAALQNVPKELYESAATDGASTLQVVPAHHRAGRPAGDGAGGHPGHDHRRQPLHRALPAHQRRRAQRRLHLPGAADVPARHRAGQPRHGLRHRRGARGPRAA